MSPYKKVLTEYPWTQALDKWAYLVRHFCGQVPCPLSLEPQHLPVPIRDEYLHLIQLRIDQYCTHAEEALDDLHSLLLMRSMMQKSKDQHMHGQRQQTQSVKLLGNVKRWIQATAEKYRSIREALLQLVAPLHETSWEKIFLSLERSDMVGLTSMDDTDKVRVERNWPGYGRYKE